MITKDDYEKAIEIVNKYKFQEKRFAGRKKIPTPTNEEIEEIIKIVFEHFQIVNYYDILEAIKTKFKCGTNVSKRILTKMVIEAKIINKGRGIGYEKN